MPFVPANPYEYLFSGGNRSFNKLPDQKQASFSYAFNPGYDNGNGITGQWQPFTMSDQGALRVDVGSGIAVTLTGTNVVVDDVAVTGGNINVNGFDTLTGQVAQLQVAVDAITGVVVSKWQKTKTAGYAQAFGAVTGACLVNKVQGYAQPTGLPSFIQLFDATVAPTVGTVPDFVVGVQNNNYFLNLAEAGVEFTQGLQIVNSSTADVYTPQGAPSFIANVVYKES